MQIHLHRHYIGETACDGTITIEGDHICDTAENSQYRPRVGTYRILLRFSKIYRRKMPFLVESSNTFLAFGNGIYGSSDGRILLGSKIIHGCVCNSRKAFMPLYNRINAALRRHHEVTLTITEDSS